MTNNSDKIRLKQEMNLETLFKKCSVTEMITVYLSDKSENHDYFLYCALIPNSEVENCLKDFSWSLYCRQSYPEVKIHCENNAEVKIYHRYGDNQGIEPLILVREFYGIREGYKEIGEDFRLFHCLYHDIKENKFIKIDDNGDEEVVAVVKEDRITIRLKEIRQYLAFKEMHLAIQFDYREHSQQELQQLGLSAEENIRKYNELECWALSFADIPSSNFVGLSKLFGKKLIAPFPKPKGDEYELADGEQSQYADFIIGTNEDGDNIMHSANPAMLDNRFGANPQAPHYLTPIDFRKTVLDKYYNQPSKFRVEDGYLHCGSLWGLEIDNHHLDKVCVYLGDLGYLAYQEQLHWKSHNISPSGKVSNVFFSRSILGEFTNSNQPDHLFKRLYGTLADTCSKCLGWQILLPLSLEDSHHLTSMRILATENQRDFDELILALTKILVDSLNEKQLNSFIPVEKITNIKGSISRLEIAFQVCKIGGHEDHINFLRKLQNLRSSGSAHRKGKEYQKIANEFGISSASLITVFEEILKKSNAFLEFLEQSVSKLK